MKNQWFVVIVIGIGIADKLLTGGIPQSYRTYHKSSEAFSGLVLYPFQKLWIERTKMLRIFSNQNLNNLSNSFFLGQ